VAGCLLLRSRQSCIQLFFDKEDMYRAGVATIGIGSCQRMMSPTVGLHLCVCTGALTVGLYWWVFVGRLQPQHVFCSSAAGSLSTTTR
jgi:hypothetical protein